MRYCINEASTMPTDFATDVKAYAAAGFAGIELWLAKVDTYLKRASLADAAALLADHGLVASAACAQGQLLLSQGEARSEAISAFRAKLKICQALGAPVIIVFSESPASVTLGDYERAAENLAEAAEVAESYGVKIALEFIKGCPLVGCVSTAMGVIEASGHDNVGLLFDTFHYFAGVSKPADIDAIPHGKVAFVHVNDCLDIPRERLTDAQRTFLGRGPIPTRQLVQQVAAKGYDGWLSFEILDRAVWERDPFAVAAEIKRNLEEVLG